jgi:hypothetical protein
VGRIVIVAYRPNPGREVELLEEVRCHVPTLRREGFATDRAPVVMRAGDGTIVEVFEWMSDAAVERAHHDPFVQAMWGRFGELCTCEPLTTLPEAQGMFATFDAIEL